MKIATAGVVGLGTMGAGIAEVFARAGLQVLAVEATDELAAAGHARVEHSLARAVDRGRLDAGERDAILARISVGSDRSSLAEADLVTEAVPERMEVKAELFAELDRICPPQTILATNTSSLPVTQVAAVTGRPERVLGLHFFNPAPVMTLVEVVHTVTTDAEVTAAVRELAQRCGKTPVVVGDRAGFVANALLFGYLNAAARAAEASHAAVADIDTAIVAATGLPMGPLTLLDMIGLDVSLDVLETMYAETRDQRYAASPLLRRLVMAGRLGRKTGQGYYSYASGAGGPVAVVGQATDGSPPRRTDRVVAVSPAPSSSRVLAALSSLELVDPEAASDADVAVVDGGSPRASAELVARVARHVPAGAVIAVATEDEAPVAVVASGVDADVVGLHVPLAVRPGVVEVVAPLGITPDAVATVKAVVAAAGLTPLVCRDRPGYLVEWLLLPHLGDAVRMVDDGYASAADVDTAMRRGCGYPQGPFEMLAAIGADDVRSALLHLAAATHLPSLAPAPLLDELAAAGFGAPVESP